MTSLGVSKDISSYLSAFYIHFIITSTRSTNNTARITACSTASALSLHSGLILFTHIQVYFHICIDQTTKSLLWLHLDDPNGMLVALVVYIYDIPNTNSRHFGHIQGQHFFNVRHLAKIVEERLTLDECGLCHLDELDRN